MADASAIATGHQGADENVRVPVLLGVSVAVLLVIGAIIGLAMLGWPFREAPETPAPPEAGFMPPRLQVAPARETRLVRLHAEAQLSGYGWIDRDKGIVRVPIERAMQLLVERGMPARKKGSRPGGEEEGK